MNISGNVNLIINGDVYGGNAPTINVLNGSSLKMYIVGNMTSNNGFHFNNLTNIPRNLKIYGASNGVQNFSFSSNSIIFGTIYAPNANVSFRDNCDFYGAVVAKSVSSHNSCNFYCDVAIPEPCTLALLGLSGMLLSRNKK